MEEKRKDLAGTPPTPTIETPAPASEPVTSSRRRGGGQKRKLTSINSSGGGGIGSGALDPQTISSKRQARDKPQMTPLPSIHPNAMPGGKMDADSRDGVKGGDFGGICDNLEAFEEQIEAEYEAVTSRAGDVHVVPVHTGWFSWTKIHQLEERMLPSFFDGKSEGRTPEVYMEIRNWIMKKFHQNPNSKIELEHLSELAVGDSDARQEVMEFLDYWGLINYHPFPPNEPTTVTVDDDDYDDEEASKRKSLLEKLFQFETVQSITPFVTRTDTEKPTIPSGLLPESVIAEELFKSEGPDVGYHCNSCSTDCSRKRYHCQKQADFDLCAECFSNGKFGSDMSPSDFILMEPAEASGVNGGKWTDQETLLLLEAIELFRDNWSEIAEHVATKTKAQCILHFVQMPIEDAFCNSDDENAVTKESSVSVSHITEKSSPKSDQDRDTASEVVAEKADSPSRASDDHATSCQAVTSNPEQVNKTCKSFEAAENFVHKALREAFESVGSLSSPGEKLSFAEAGNPVMALASFLVQLVEPNIAAGSVQSFFKTLSSNRSSEELSARHCFRLEDPPVDKKNLSQSDCTATESIVTEAGKDENEQNGKQNDGIPESVDGVRNDTNENKDSACGKLKPKGPASDLKPVASTSSECAEKSACPNDSDRTVTTHEVAQKASSRKTRPRKRALKDAEASIVSASHSEIHPSYPKESEGGPLAGKPCPSQDPPKDDVISLSEKKETELMVMSNSISEKEESAGDKEAKECEQGKNPLVTKNDFDINKLKRVAVTALSAAAVKAKLLADQEEDQIRQLANLLVEKQLYKLESKLSFFSDLENVVIRVKEQLDRSKQRLFQERAQIIAARLGMQGSARPPSQHLPPNRAAANFPNQVSRPIMGVNAPRPPISRPPMAPNFASNVMRPAGSSTHPHFSSFGTR